MDVGQFDPFWLLSGGVMTMVNRQKELGSSALAQGI
jgi:hypothetical protein